MASKQNNFETSIYRTIKRFQKQENVERKIGSGLCCLEETNSGSQPGLGLT
jgi:hypothetical protein